jgi:hypothetical protein
MDVCTQKKADGHGPGFVFLTPQILLIPHPMKNTLDVFRIPPVGTTPCELANLRILSFCLPERLARDSHNWVECFSAPNSRDREGVQVPGHMHAPFDNVAHKAIVRFQYIIGQADDSNSDAYDSDSNDESDDSDDESDDESDDSDDSDGPGEYNFFILREPFMGLITQFSKTCDNIEWPRWGPQCSRKVKAFTKYEYGCRGTVAGQRIVTLQLENSNRTPISILNFNQYAVHQATNSTNASDQATNSTNASASICVIEPDAEHTCSSAEPVRYIKTTTINDFEFDCAMINNQNIFGIKASAVAFAL